MLKLQQTAFSWLLTIEGRLQMTSFSCTSSNLGSELNSVKSMFDIDFQVRRKHINLDINNTSWGLQPNPVASIKTISDGIRDMLRTLRTSKINKTQMKSNSCLHPRPKICLAARTITSRRCPSGDRPKTSTISARQRATIFH